MQFTQTLTLLALATSASGVITSNTDSLSDPQTFASSASCRPITDDTVYDCGSPTDTFLVNKVTLSPRLPERGQNVTVTITGTAQQQIIEGTKAHVIAKLGLITVIEKDYDFCKEIEGGSSKCPIQKGDNVIIKVVEVPANIPSGRYVVDGIVTLPNQKQVSHLKFKVTL